MNDGAVAAMFLNYCVVPYSRDVHAQLHKSSAHLFIHHFANGKMSSVFKCTFAVLLFSLHDRLLLPPGECH